MVQALFDEGRRREIRHAIERGKLIGFRKREPRTDAMAGKGFWPQEMQLDTGGYDFKFERLTPEGNAVILISCGGETVAEKTIPTGKESRIKLPDGNGVAVTPSRISTGNVCSISFEGKKGSD